VKEPRGAERGSKNQETLLGPLVDIGEYHVTFLVKCVLRRMHARKYTY